VWQSLQAVIFFFNLTFFQKALDAPLHKVYFEPAVEFEALVQKGYLR